MDNLSNQNYSIMNCSCLLLVCFIFINIFSIAPNVNFYDTKDVRIDYISISHEVQLINKPIIITCILTPFNEIPNVHIDVYYLNNVILDDRLSYNELGKFDIILTYNKTGKYTFFIYTMIDYKQIKSQSYEFWITSSLNDIDNDKIPNWWEEKYNMNPKQLNDVLMDFDNDGYTNLEEFKMNTNPQVNNYVENSFYHIKQNIGYIIFSFLLFLLLISFSICGIRRSDTWQ